VVGPDGSNCEAGATDPSCSAKVNVANPGTGTGTGTAPASGGHPATPSGSLPKTGVGNNEWLLAESAAALLLAGGAMTAAKRRRRS
jgi:LPXTG-motif cell wall-anchored protein